MDSFATVIAYFQGNFSTPVLELPTTTSADQHAANTNIAKTLTSISAVLSMLGTLIIIVTYIAWKDIRSSSRKILVYISIADFMTAFGNMMSTEMAADSVSDISCKVQSFITTCSSMCSFFWTTFLAFFLYIVIAKRRPKLGEKMMIIFHLFGWGIPLGITIAAASWPVSLPNQTVIGVLGNSNDKGSAGWCWIRFELEFKDGLIWMLVSGKAWEIASYFLIMFLYLGLKYHIYREVHYKREQFITTSSLEAAIKADKKLTFVPVIFILLRIWGTVRFLLYAVDSTLNKGTWLVYFQGVGDSGQGFANFMLFCFFTEKFQRKLRSSLTRCCACLRRQKPSSSVDTPSYVVPNQKGGQDVNQTMINERSPLLASMEHHPPNLLK